MSHATEGGEIVIHAVSRASLALEVPGMVIYADPVGDLAAYANLAQAPELIAAEAPAKKKRAAKKAAAPKKKPAKAAAARRVAT